MEKIKKLPQVETYELGKIPVDSGTIMMTDPCYTFLRKGDKPIKSYDQVLEDYERDDYFNNRIGMSLKINNHDYAKGVVFSTGLGDGSYPVTVDVVDLGDWGKRVKSATITFLDDLDIEHYSKPIKEEEEDKSNVIKLNSNE